MFPASRSCVQILALWGHAFWSCNMRWGSWMNGTTIDLRILSWYFGGGLVFFSAFMFLIGSWLNNLHLRVVLLMSCWGLKGSLAVWSTLMHLTLVLVSCSRSVKIFSHLSYLFFRVLLPLPRHTLDPACLPWTPRLRWIRCLSQFEPVSLHPYLDTHLNTLAPLPEDLLPHLLVLPPLCAWLLLGTCKKKLNIFKDLDSPCHVKSLLISVHSKCHWYNAPVFDVHDICLTIA